MKIAQKNLIGLSLLVLSLALVTTMMIKQMGTATLRLQKLLFLLKIMGV